MYFLWSQFPLWTPNKALALASLFHLGTLLALTFLIHQPVHRRNDEPSGQS